MNGQGACLCPIAEGIPEELKAEARWVGWKPVWDGERWDKKPWHRSGGYGASSTNPRTWSTYDQVWDAYEAKKIGGIGFVPNGDGITAVDFDKCRCPALDGVVDEMDMVLPEVAEHIRRLNSYTEVSPSGTGIHVFLKGHLPVNIAAKTKGHYEAFYSEHYITVTGRRLNGFPEGIEERSMELSTFYKEIWGIPEKGEVTEQTAVNPALPHVIDWKEKAFASRNGAEIKKLWDGETRGDQSKTDLALMSHLAFWLAGDRSAMDAAFRESKRMRPKWDEKHYSDGRTYGEATINKALEGCKSYYGEKQSKPEWEDPIPFDGLHAIPQFPLHALPNIGRRFVEAVSAIHQVDPGLPAVIYLAVVSASRMGDEVDLGHHKEPLNLYITSILDSGERKTAVMNDMTRPLFIYQKDIQDMYGVEAAAKSSQRRIRANRLAQAEKTAANPKTDPVVRREAEALAEVLSQEIADDPETGPPVLTVNDVTTEALSVLMQANKERMSIFSDEGGIFKNISGSSWGKEGNFDLYLKAHTGGSYSCFRIGRPPVTMIRPLLAMCLLVQRDVLREIGGNKQFRGRGMLARFLWVIHGSKIGNRLRQMDKISPSLIEEYKQHIFHLLKDIGPDQELRLSPEADRVWTEIHNDSEREQRSGGRFERMKDWGSKSASSTARIAGILHHGEGESPTTDRSEMSRASLNNCLAVHIAVGGTIFGTRARLSASQERWYRRTMRFRG